VSDLVPARFWQLALAKSVEGLVDGDAWEAAAAIKGRLDSRGVVLAIDGTKRDEIIRGPETDWRTRLKPLRDARGLSGAAVAASAGISRTHLWNVETSKQEPTVAVALRIASALGISLSDLLLSQAKPDA
jgi:DNA-binding XRE family transcriptional regulator